PRHAARRARGRQSFSGTGLLLRNVSLSLEVLLLVLELRYLRPQSLDRVLLVHSLLACDVVAHREALADLVQVRERGDRGDRPRQLPLAETTVERQLRLRLPVGVRDRVLVEEGDVPVEVLRVIPLRLVEVDTLDEV